MSDHFSLFQLSPSFDLDLAALEQTYFTLQRQFHPDRFVGKPMPERLSAAEKSMAINKAYDTLKNPLTRAQHMLALQNIIVNTDHDTVKPRPELLVQVMEWQEALSAAPETARATIAQALESTLKDLSSAFAKNAYLDAAHLTLQAQYLTKMLH